MLCFCREWGSLICSHRVIVTRLLSAAGTGYFYTIKKPRIKDRMTLRKYDPVGRLTDTACLIVFMLSNSPIP